MGLSGPTVKTGWAEHAITVRCLQRLDGSLAEPGDDESELIAVVGRSYSTLELRSSPKLSIFRSVPR